MKLECSFCGRGPDEVLTFFQPGQPTPPPEGARICICDRCIHSCHDRLTEKEGYTVEFVEKQKFRKALTDSSTDTLIRAVLDNDYRDLFLEVFAQHADLVKVDPETPPQPAALHLLPASFLRENRILPWRIEDHRLVVAFYNPLHMLDIYDETVHKAGMPLRLALLPREKLLECIEKHVKTND